MHYKPHLKGVSHVMVTCEACGFGVMCTLRSVHQNRIKKGPNINLMTFKMFFLSNQHPSESQTDSAPCEM